MRRERLYLQDIVGAADAIGRFLDGVERETFLASELLQSAVVHQLAIMGEAAAHVTPATRVTEPGIPWSRIAAFRNFVVHEYFAVQWEIVWNAARVNAPAVRAQVAAMLPIFPDEA